MDHQSFRFYIPGIVFLLPIYVVACWITINFYHDSDVRLFVLVGGITTFPAIALPIGWWIYNAYRMWWLVLTRGGYENKDFVKLVRKDTKPFYSPSDHSVLIDFSHIRDIGSWIKIDVDIFRKAFYPFSSKEKYDDEIKRESILPEFTEALSDIILWKDGGYDYARSISSVRYGLESSLFAIVLGSIYAYGLKVIWLCKLNADYSFSYIFWTWVLIVVTISLIITLIIRWWYADKEYDARLILTTLTSMKSNYFDTKSIEANIPVTIIEKVNQLKLPENPYAAFDLDNTLLIDDIGEAVFAALIEKKLIKNFNWSDYSALINEDRKSAYKKVIEVMNGLPLKRLYEVTHEVINRDEPFIEIEGKKIPIPKPNSIMQSLISYLRYKGIEVYIVTASNKISADIICWEFFGIPSSHVLGADVGLDDKNRIAFAATEIPFAEGKVNALRQKFKERPIVTGGDGVWDKYLLDYTSLKGIRLWLGQDKNEYEKLKESFYKNLDFYHVMRY